MHPDPDAERRLATGLAAEVQVVQRPEHVDAARDRTRRMVRLVDGGPEVGHHAVPQELVERASVAEDDLDHRGMVLVQHRDDGFACQVL